MEATGTDIFAKTMCGTPNYLAPEVVLNEPGMGYDSIVDSWSVGVMIYSMLTGLAPFNDDDTLQLSERMKRRVPDWAPMFRFSEQAVDFTRRLLDLDPRNRMSLSEARYHQWLSNCHRENNGPRIPVPRVDPALLAIPAMDSAMQDASIIDPQVVSAECSQKFQHMNLDSMPSMSSDESLYRQRGVAVVSARSSDMSVETINPPPLTLPPTQNGQMAADGSWEVLGESQLGNGVPSNTNGNGKSSHRKKATAAGPSGANARKRKDPPDDSDSSLSPLSDEENNENVMRNGKAGATTAADRPLTPAKGRGNIGKGKAKVISDEVMSPRRSTRQSKAPRLT